MQAIVEEITSIEALQALVRSTPGPLVPVGGSTKPALSHPPAAIPLALAGLTGITEYNPSEFTFTARAGTPLATIEAALAEHGQSLPFDPPLAAQGATLGGTIAAGLSGPRRWRFGGLRDFLLGVAFVDGQGRSVRGGGKVVKNAAGLDTPKLFIGSLGRLGILTEATFKVFPSPPAFATLRVPCTDLRAAQTLLARLAPTALELEAVDMTIVEGAPLLWLRLGGLPAALPARLERLRAFVGGGAALEDDAPFWAGQNAFAWVPADSALAKVPITPHTLPALDAALAVANAARVYSVGGHLAWVAWPGEMAALDALLAAQGLAGLLLRGEHAAPLLGARTGLDALARVKQVLDPAGRFLPY